MKFNARRQSALAPIGLVGTARVGRRIRILLPRLRTGDIAVLDHVDLDRAMAQALVDSGVVGVVNSSQMISGRYPNLGPEVLAQAGIMLVEAIGTGGFSAISDGSAVRLHEGGVYVDDTLVAEGREVDLAMIRSEMDEARTGLVTQLETFTRNSTEFLRREQDLLLHGLGVPRPATTITGRPVVVVVRGHDYAAELEAIRPFLREQQPVLIAVERAAEVLREAGHRPDIVIVNGAAEAGETPPAKILKAARDVVVRLERGGERDSLEQLDRIGIRPLRFESSASCEDAALILAHAGDASVIIGVGMHATLDDFLDRQRSDLASTYLTRLKVGPRLVDASAVPYLYSGRVRPIHLLLVMLAGFIALIAAIGVTPVGQEWADQLSSAWSGLVDALPNNLQGLF